MLLVILLAAGCSAGSATFTRTEEGTTETESRSYPDAWLTEMDYGWRVRLWGRSGGSFLNPLDGLFSERDFVDIRLPARLYAGLVIDIAESGHSLDAGIVRPLARNPYDEYTQGRIEITGWDEGLKRVRGKFDATAEGRRITGSFTATAEDDE